MSSERPIPVVKELDEFVEWLLQSSKSPERVYRGQANTDWNLQASWDRKVPKHSHDQGSIDKEAEYIDLYSKQAFRFLGRLEQEYMKNPNDKVLRMTVMQHFGAPTRLLDWTQSPAVAAYFACIDESPPDGAIWWINEKAVENYCAQNWEIWKFEHHPELDGQVDLNDGIFNVDVAEFITMCYLRIPFSRAQAQRGLFTIGSRLGIDHDAVLKKQLSEGAYGRVTIRANLKGPEGPVIDYLGQMGIDAVSLQHTGADRVGLKMAWAWDKERLGISAMGQTT